MRNTCLMVLALAVLAGCTRVHRSFPGQDPDLVWTALLAVAETPDYGSDDPDEQWNVRQNDVWVDPQSTRLEIYREVEKILYRSRTQPLRKQRTWRFQVLFEREDPPHVIFISRGMGVPTRAQEEADRFFSDVWDILEGGTVGRPEMDEPETAPTTEPAIDEGWRQLDFEELEPVGP